MENISWESTLLIVAPNYFDHKGILIIFSVAL